MVIVVGVFMEITIQGSVNVICDRIEASIFLLMYSIPNKDTFDCLRFQLGTILFWEMDIDNTSEYSGR